MTYRELEEMIQRLEHALADTPPDVRAVVDAVVADFVREFGDLRCRLGACKAQVKELRELNRHRRYVFPTCWRRSVQ